MRLLNSQQVSDAMSETRPLDSPIAREEGHRASEGVEAAAKGASDLAEAKLAATDAKSALDDRATEALAELSAASSAATTETTASAEALVAERARFEATTKQLETQRQAAVTQINEALQGIESRSTAAETARQSGSMRLSRLRQMNMPPWSKS
jgi:hypothetical protein